jgi:hypothetical protein
MLLLDNINLMLLFLSNFRDFSGKFPVYFLRCEYNRDSEEFVSDLFSIKSVHSRVHEKIYQKLFWYPFRSTIKKIILHRQMGVIRDRFIHKACFRKK